MREMSRFVCDVAVLRKGSWQTIPSTALVPGDLIDVARADFHTIPADLVLLSGEAIVNESMLTGESVPVPKVSIEQPHIFRELRERPGELSPEASRHVLYSGTRVVRMRKSGNGYEGEAVAVVLLTAFNTTKGALVRSMLFPKPMGFKFYRDSFRFIGVLAGIAGLGFIVSSIRFVEMGIKWSTIAKRAGDLVTIVVPPALPATMSIGTTFAIARLRKLGIFCISPNRVNIGGKINIVCFDKTGTLTEDGLDVLGVRSVDRSHSRFSQMFTDIEDVPIFGAADSKTPLLHALATCHALRVVDGTIVGDPLDLRMFEFTKWTLEEGKEPQPPRASVEDRRETDRIERGVGKPGGVLKKVPERVATLVQLVVRPPGGERFQLEDAIKGAGKKRAHFLELGVIRAFDFVSALRRMTVLVKKLKSQSVEVYTKGAPEVMAEICDRSTLPHDYDEILSEYTRKGFRVIAVAAKSVPGLTWLKAQRMKREQAESDLRFLGLIVFENKLKPGTEPAIYSLRTAHIACRMCTGDNIRTGISVARECGMISEGAHVYLPSFVRGGPEDPESVISWTDVDRPRKRLDHYSLRPVTEYDADDQESASAFSLESNGESSPYHLAISGDVFRWMIDYGARETLHRMLVKGIVYARMSPDEKQELVEKLQGLGYVTSFCGDGANDCGALKAADVGISLSEAEASVAAPFTSRVADISCVLEVIKEGRAALVTSFSCFKFMALYSLIQFTTVTILYSMASSLGDFQFLYIDLFLILPLAVTMGRTDPFPRLVPKRPTANLISKHVLTSLIGQIIITSGFQLFVFHYVRSQSWYNALHLVAKPDDLEIASFENSSLFLVSCFQYILVAAVFCVGPPYRQPLTTNGALVAVMSGLVLASLYILLVPTSFIYYILELVIFPRQFRSELLLLIAVDCGLSWIFEVWAAARVAKFIGNSIKAWRRWRGTRKSDGRLYKSIERDLE
ncbi:hypothetical protein BT69DRAFT_143159 [Atractiella rhizophila]|nr:hypothetical protein BT69DRAFT_143159 [Atractiella rhizophila]